MDRRGRRQERRERRRAGRLGNRFCSFLFDENNFSPREIELMRIRRDELLQEYEAITEILERWEGDK